MEIKKGKIEDVKVIINVIKDAIIDMELEGIYQWDDIYPSEEVITNDVNSENLYVYIDKCIIKGFIVLNECQDKAYESINWEYNNGKHLVIHRLCISPKYKGQGIATTLIRYVEKLGQENKYESIRLDAFSKNSRACKLYEKNGYNIRGIVNFRKGDFFCFEKVLCAIENNHR